LACVFSRGDSLPDGRIWERWGQRGGAWLAMIWVGIIQNRTGMRIGILSDTHLPNLIRHLHELGPEPAHFFATVDLILHGGDLTSPMVLDWLEQFAPVLCTTGNNDPIVDARCKEVEILDVHGWRLGMVHSLRRGFRPMPELQQLFPTPVDIMIAGDTHYEVLEYRDEVV